MKIRFKMLDPVTCQFGQIAHTTMTAPPRVGEEVEIPVRGMKEGALAVFEVRGVRHVLDETGDPGDTFAEVFLQALGGNSLTHLQWKHERLEAEVATVDRVLRSSVPDRYKDCTSAVGGVQGYIAELEGLLEGRSGVGRAGGDEA